MIPKTIHCCWLGKGQPHETAQKCIASWSKIFPDYDIKCWNEETFDINAVPYVRDAVAAGKYAYAADYIRLYALYTEGGIYLDCDVEALGRMDDWHDLAFFAGLEYRNGSRQKLFVSPAVLGAEKGNRLIKNALDSFEGRPFYNEDGSINTVPLSNTLTPFLSAVGWHRRDEDQRFPDVGIAVFSTQLISNPNARRSDHTRFYHYCVKSWAPKSFWDKLFKK